MDIDKTLRFFAEEVGLAVALENGGKIGAEEAFRRIKKRYKLLKSIVKGLDDGKNPL